MPRRRPDILLHLLLLAVLLASPLAAMAQPGRGGDGPQNSRDRFERQETRRGGVSLGEAVAAVQRATGGRVLSADTRNGSHRIKVLLPGGRVRLYQVHRDTGAGMP
jgi:hypothetical protein